MHTIFLLRKEILDLKEQQYAECLSKKTSGLGKSGRHEIQPLLVQPSSSIHLPIEYSRIAISSHLDLSFPTLNHSALKIIPLEILQTPHRLNSSALLHHTKELFLAPNHFNHSFEHQHPRCSHPPPSSSRSSSPPPSPSPERRPQRDKNPEPKTPWIHAGLIHDVHHIPREVFFSFTAKRTSGPFKGKRYLRWANDATGTPFGNKRVGQIWRNMITWDKHHERHWAEYLDNYGTWVRKCATVGRKAQRDYLLRIWLDPNFVDPYPRGKATVIGPPLNVIHAPDALQAVPHRAHSPDPNGQCYPNTRILMSTCGISTTAWKDAGDTPLEVIELFMRGRMFNRDMAYEDGYEKQLLMQIESAWFEVGWRVDARAMRDAMHAIRDGVVRNVFATDEWVSHPPLKIDQHKGDQVERMLDRIRRDLDDDDSGDDGFGGGGGGGDDDNDDDDNDNGGGDGNRGRRGYRGWNFGNFGNRDDDNDNDMGNSDDEDNDNNDGDSGANPLFVSPARRRRATTSSGSSSKQKSKDKKRKEDKGKRKKTKNNKKSKKSKGKKEKKSARSKKGKEKVVNLVSDDEEDDDDSWANYPESVPDIDLDIDFDNDDDLGKGSGTQDEDSHQAAEVVDLVENDEESVNEDLTNRLVSQHQNATSPDPQRVIRPRLLGRDDTPSSADPSNYQDLTGNDADEDDQASSHPNREELRKLREQYMRKNEEASPPKKAQTEASSSRPKPLTRTTPTIGRLFSHYNKVQTEAQASEGNSSPSSTNSGPRGGEQRTSAPAESSNAATGSLISNRPPQQAATSPGETRPAPAPVGSNPAEDLLPLRSASDVTAWWLSRRAAPNATPPQPSSLEAGSSPPKRPRLEAFQENEDLDNSEDSPKKLKTEDTSNVIVKDEGELIWILDDDDEEPAQIVKGVGTGEDPFEID
ncbi:hypothetical protein G7Y89_g1815 [Cudoniella acicularis]|uniref:Uncharacterized protein n=1 Tax=Cudoniella acicularis TaxID=354080 RepID=A0A8H4RUI7_9HELO|nr:hypothetical protein G7Y89_g1815 [Cudoniella acicularis]